MIFLRIALPLTIAVHAAACSHQELEGHWHKDPNDVVFVSTDVQHFWEAHVKLSAQPEREQRLTALQEIYLGRGTEGLTTYANDFGITAAYLLAAIDTFGTYYEHIRDASLMMPDSTDQQRMRDVFAGWQRLYPETLFPDVSFVIGTTEIAGTVNSAGLVIGTEMLARDANDNVSFTPQLLTEWGFSRETLPTVVAHELAHAQQKFYPGPQTLLFWVIIEGSAEFLCELVTGRSLTGHLREYGDAHEAELWAELQANGNELGKGSWFIGRGNKHAGSIGFYVGYQIARSYYERQPDPTQAVRDMLNIDDFEQFLADSGYANKFQ